MLSEKPIEAIIEASQVVVCATQEIEISVEAIIERSIVMAVNAYDIFGDCRTGSTAEFQAAHIQAVHSQVVLEGEKVKELRRIANAIERSVAAQERSAAAQERMAVAMERSAVVQEQKGG